MVVMMMVVVISGYQAKGLNGLVLIGIRTTRNNTKVVNLIRGWVVAVLLVPVVVKVKTTVSNVV
jgi:hypothetical protein